MHRAAGQVGPGLVDPTGEEHSVGQAELLDPGGQGGSQRPVAEQVIGQVGIAEHADRFYQQVGSLSGHSRPLKVRRGVLS